VVQSPGKVLGIGSIKSSKGNLYHQTKEEAMEGIPKEGAKEGKRVR
jgi:hypothetical protein